MNAMRHARKCDILLVGYKATENLGLRYLVSYLAKHHVCAEIISFNPGEKAGVLGKIIASNPAVVGFSILYQHMSEDFHELMYYLRSNGVKAHFTLRDQFPTIEYRSMLSRISYLDTIICDEAEETLLELYRMAFKPGSWEKIKGLAFREGSEIRRTPGRNRTNYQDALPFSFRISSPPVHRKSDYYRTRSAGRILSA